MLDLETLGTRPGSVILSIGAVRFDANGIKERPFYQVIDIESSLSYGLTIEGAALRWWLQKPPEAQEVLSAPGASLPRVLQNFSEWLRGVENDAPWEGYLWAKGPSFDCALLEAAYARIGWPIPWRFTHERCVRTIIAENEWMPEVPLGPGEVAHHALTDARRQAQLVVNLWERNRVKAERRAENDRLKEANNALLAAAVKWREEVREAKRVAEGAALAAKAPDEFGPVS